MIQATDRYNDWYPSDFLLFERHLNGASASPVHAIRQAAISRFAELGFPTTHDEEWKYTNVAPIARVHFKPIFAGDKHAVAPNDVDVRQFAFAGTHANKLVFVNGHFSKEFSSLTSLPKGAIVESIASTMRNKGDWVSRNLTAHFHDNAFTALNTAFFQDGAMIHIPDNTVLDEPLYVFFISTGGESSFVSHPRSIVLVGKSSRLSLVESYLGQANTTYFVNTVTEVVAGEQSFVEHTKIQNEHENAFHVGSMHVQQRANSNFTSHSISLGAALARNNVAVSLDAEGIECTLNGLAVANGHQLMDNHTTIDHAKPHCNSHQLYKSILNGNAKGVFNGKIFVRQDAQKTDAKQTNKTLLLSDEATIDTKPQLEIFADDVKCTHGATVGQLDEEQVFYLRSRGIETGAARDILTYAFASDVINRVTTEPVRDYLGQLLHDRLEEGRERKEV